MKILWKKRATRVCEEKRFGYFSKERGFSWGAHFDLRGTSWFL